MTHPILPKLKDGHTVKAFPRAGVWELRLRDSLTQLTQSLEIAGNVDSDVSSIPDMWARPLLFEMALLNPTHVLHERVVGEWRGFLAMLALKQALGLDRLTAVPISIPVASVGPSADGKAPRDFLSTLSKLLPRATLSRDTSWRSLWIFLYNSKPVGITSPTTLIATAADCLDRISAQDVPWFDGERLLDPVAVLSPAQKQLVSGWLAQVISSLLHHPSVDLDRANAISALFQKFREDLHTSEPNRFGLGKSAFAIFGQQAGIFAYLDKPAAPIVSTQSNVELIPTPGRSPGRRLLIFDRTVADQWKTDPQNITLSGAQTLASPKAQVGDAEVWRGADFFTPKLVLVYQESAFPGTLSTGAEALKRPGGTAPVTPILPLNPKLLDYLSAEELAQSVRWEQTPEGIKIYLSLNLTGLTSHSGKHSTVELSRLYRSEDVHTLNNVPVLEVWPNFSAPGWKAYYTCYSANEVTTTFEATPWARGKAPEEKVIPLTSPRLRRYWRSEVYPEAMICSTGISAENSRRVESQNVGMLLLRPPAAIQQQGTSWRIGVDFGASSTTICVGRGRGGGKPAELEDRKVSITASGSHAQLFDLFLPNQTTEMPVLSFFQDFTSPTPGAEIRPLLDGHAYLLESSDFLPESAGLAFDLKWSPNPVDRMRVRAFLTQLCLQTTAEVIAKHGATSVQWSFSFPTALDHERRQGFSGVCEQATTESLRLSGLQQSAPNSTRTESEAAAFYFVDYANASTAHGAVFIDIGGSTSDIAVWQNDAPVWQTSVLLAGRCLLSNYLWHQPGFLFELGLPETEGLIGLKNRSGNERKYLHAVTDAILRYNSERIFQQLPLHAGSSSVKKLQLHLALGLGGLFFYTGNLLRYLMNQGRYKREVPSIYLGGNGSRVLRWLDIDGDGRMIKLCKALFSHAAGWTEQKPFDVRVSQSLKMEAALGLVSERPATEVTDSDQVLAGESFVFEDSREERAWDTVLAPADFTHRLSPPARLERLSEFLQVFNKLAGAAGLPLADNEESNLAAVRMRLNQTLSERQRKNANDVVVEPIFSMALRHLLEVRLGG